MRLTPRRQRPQLGSTAEHRVMEYQSWSLATVYRDGFFCNRVTLTFDLLTSGSMHADVYQVWC